MVRTLFIISYCLGWDLHATRQACVSDRDIYNTFTEISILGGRGLNHLMLVLFIGKNSKKLDPKSHLINQSYGQDDTMKWQQWDHDAML